LFLSSQKYDPGSSRIPDPDPYFLPIPDPGSSGQKGTGSLIGTRNTAPPSPTNIGAEQLPVPTLPPPPLSGRNIQETKKNLCPAHGAGGVPVEPGRDAVLAEDVLALQHGRLLVGILQHKDDYNTPHTFYRLFRIMGYARSNLILALMRLQVR